MAKQTLAAAPPGIRGTPAREKCNYSSAMSLQPIATINQPNRVYKSSRSSHSSHARACWAVGDGARSKKSFHSL